MGRHELKIKRGAFRNRTMSSKSRYSTFEEQFNRRKKNSGRNRIILMIAIVILTMILLFTFNRISGNSGSSSDYPEIHIDVTPQTL